MDKIEGFNKHRRNDPLNTLEVKFYEAAIVQKKNWSNIFSFAVFGTDNGNRPNQHLTDREENVVFSILQWLGSHVGTSFLRSVGFINVESFDYDLKRYNEMLENTTDEKQRELIQDFIKTINKLK